MKPILLSVAAFGLSIPALIILMSSLQKPDLIAQTTSCGKDQVFRASDQSCYVLQGE